MYELNRARLAGIGPRGARYSDVTLDLSGLGQTVPPTNLFDPPGRRPAPSSLLLLENGGGKSVLLKLLFSVVLPGRRNTVGGTSLEKFVLDGDTGHVALEWMHVSTGDRLVTAKTYQRRSRNNDKNPLAEAWYSFRPSATLDLDSLPITVDGRRRRLTGYKEAVEEADRLEATTELNWLGEDQGGWRDHLRERRLEPDLFDIQRRMNIDEGEAAKTFNYASSKEFVDWLLTTVTDPQDATSVAGTFSQWAANLAEREQMLLERDFLEGAIAGLDPLAEAHQADRAAAREAAAAVRAAEALAAELGRRLGDERESVTRLAGERETAQNLVSTRSGERDGAREIVNEIRRQTLLLEQKEVEEQRTQLQLELNGAELELHGWQTIPAIAERDQAIATADELAAQVAAADEGAAPALTRRDEAAGRLLAKYQAEADASERSAIEHDNQASRAKSAAREADDDRSSALGGAATASERHRAAQETVTEAADRLIIASDAGLVSTGVTPAQVPELAENASADHVAKMVQLTEAKSTAGAQAMQCRGLGDELGAANRAAREAEKTSEAASGALAVVEDEARRLGRLTVLLEAIGADGSDDEHTQPHSDDGDAPARTLSVDALDDAAARLLDRLGHDIDAHTELLVELRTGQREDTRVIDALGEGGLLPPREEVERALEVLAAAGVAAHAGWRYLHDAVPASERVHLIARHPALADGIVLVDAAQLPSARHALVEARLLPAAAVAVSSGAALLQLHTDRGGGRDVDGAISRNGDEFVVEPTPALYDEDAAAQRREELAEQMASRGTHIQQIEEQVTAVRSGHDQLKRWRDNNPPGRLAKLREEASDALRRLESARDLVTSTTKALETADEEHRLADAATELAATAERQASEQAVQLANLAELVKSATQAQLRLPEHEAEVAKHKAAAEDALARRKEAEREHDAHARLAVQDRGQAQRHRAARDEVISTSGQVAAAVPEEALAELKAVADAAQQVYLAVAVDPDLRRQAAEAAEKVKALRTQLNLRDADHIAEAERLRATPAGADRTAWGVGASNARQRVVDVRSDVEELTKRDARLEEKVRGASPSEPGRRSWTTLSDQWGPTSPQHGHVLETEAAKELNQAQDHLDEAVGALTQIDQQRGLAEVAVTGFNEALLPLTTLLDKAPDTVDDDAAAYAGDISTAKDAAAVALAALRQTREDREHCRGALAAAIQELVRFANLSRYEALATSARRSIVESGPDLLAAQAGEWSVALEARLATLKSDLDNANRHRKTIVDRLTALVDQSVKTLRQASKLSRLPEDLAEWGGRPFLQIKFSEPDRTSTSVRVGEVVDKVAAQYAARAVGGRSRNARRDGMSLLLEAVHAAVPKGFAVDVLKPDSVLRDERVSIEEMNDVFSGGQELTAAIVLYCTLAALSANKRGQMRSRHSGVLFLDNPIGRANASYLIDLQQSVARSLGVQLIYTTGISDDRVLAAFPLWVRLRNDADLRAGLKHIQVADVVRRQLPAPYADDELAADGPAGEGGPSAPGTVTATRVHRRPSEPTAPGRPGGSHANAGAVSDDPDEPESVVSGL
ncbi:MAG: hypothetical protein ACRCY9_11400 [Phycicoccus sp.]